MILMFVRVKGVGVGVGVEVQLKGVLDTETSVNNYTHHKNQWSKVGQKDKSVCPSEKMPQEAMNSSFIPIQSVIPQKRDKVG